MRFSNVMSTRWRLPCRPPVSIDELPDHFGYLAFFFLFFGTSIGFIVYTGRPFFFFLLFTRIRSFPLYQGQQQKKSSDDLRTSSESLPSIDGSLFDIGTRICKTRWCSAVIFKHSCIFFFIFIFFFCRWFNASFSDRRATVVAFHVFDELFRELVLFVL